MMLAYLDEVERVTTVIIMMASGKTCRDGPTRY